MKYVDNSLSVVFVGDFNKKYISFEWLVTNVFQESKIEMGVSVQNEVATVSYQKDSVIIIPKQDRVMFQCKGMNEDNDERFVNYITNFTNAIPKELFTAYGINSKYSDDESLIMMQEIDSLDSQKKLVKSGYELTHITSTRTITKDGKVYNVTISSENTKTNIAINEDHQRITDLPVVSKEMLFQHFECCREILESFGFDLEETEDE